MGCHSFDRFAEQRKVGRFGRQVFGGVHQGVSAETAQAREILPRRVILVGGEKRFSGVDRVAMMESEAIATE